MTVETPENHEKLAETVSRAPSRRWIESYFELVEDIISETGLRSDDPRLVMSLPGKGTLPITVNNRYALVAFRGGESSTEFILTGNQGGVNPYLNQSDRKGRFNAIYDEDESKRPWFVRFEGDPQDAVDDEFRRFWLTAVNTEMKRIDKSPYRRYHEPAVYKAAEDSEYREQVLDESFD
jgi:hypothetical protein